MIVQKSKSSRLEPAKTVWKVALSMQIFSAIKPNEQRPTGSQCKREDYVDIKYFIGQNFNANDVDIMAFELTRPIDAMIKSLAASTLKKRRISLAVQTGGLVEWLSNNSRMR